jgi:hypothetical protein
MIRRAAPLALLLLAACGTAEPESAANRFERTEREIGERENALKGLVDNEAAQTEQRMEAEAGIALNSLNAAAEANAAEAAAPAAPATTTNKAR